jgi:enamine deaminase RidA (YjgF/YER057c/UK114 family)
MVLRMLNPTGLRPPLAHYAHGVEVSAGARLVFCSGQLGIGANGVVPDDAEAQADLCFQAIGAILAEAGMSFADLIRLNGYVTSAQYLEVYMKIRDRYVKYPPPASTLMIVSGFARPAYKIEVEAVAGRCD